MLDLGANVGGYTSAMLELKGIIHAFEACPKLAVGMRERFKNEPRVTVFQQGVSDHIYTETGLTVFNAWTLGKAGQPNKRHVSPGAIELVGAEPFDVEFTTVDAHVHGAMPVDFIKLDVDGYELRALKGAEKTIMQFRPNILIELGHIVEDIGDSNTELLAFIYHHLRYRLYDQEGQEMVFVEAPRWFPFSTTKDFAMIPYERSIEPK